MTEPEDLRWTQALVPKLSWTYAKTYANSAPHSYIHLRDSNHLSRDDFRRLAATIETFGTVKTFHGRPNIYLDVLSDHLWHMDPSVSEADLVNKASRANLYGEQRLPSTASGGFYEADRWAAYIDRMPWDDERDDAIVDQIRQHFTPDAAPSVLHVGCGGGWLLDRRVTLPWRFDGIDPSQGALNRLVRRHPSVRMVYPAPAEHVPVGLLQQRYDLLVCTNRDVPLETVGALAALADHVVLA